MFIRGSEVTNETTKVSNDIALLHRLSVDHGFSHFLTGILLENVPQ